MKLSVVLTDGTRKTASIDGGHHLRTPFPDFFPLRDAIAPHVPGPASLLARLMRRPRVALASIELESLPEGGLTAVETRLAHEVFGSLGIGTWTVMVDGKVVAGSQTSLT